VFCYYINLFNGKWQKDEVYSDLENEEAGLCNISRGGFFRHSLPINDTESSLRSLQQLADAVEKACPFAKSFGILGTGEGIVWKVLQPSEHTKYWLKMKGPSFRGRTLERNIDTKLGRAEMTKALAKDVLPEWRLEQGWQYLGEMGIERSRGGIQAFLKWLRDDVKVEEKGDIDRLDLSRALLEKQLNHLGVAWYFERISQEGTKSGVGPVPSIDLM
jgi:hypothetical protein